AAQRPVAHASVLDADLEQTVDVAAPVKHRATRLSVAAVVVRSAVTVTAATTPSPATDVVAVGVALPVAGDAIRSGAACRVANAHHCRPTVRRRRLLDHVHIAASALELRHDA